MYWILKKTWRKLVSSLQFFSLISKMGDTTLSLPFFQRYNKLQDQVGNSSASLKPATGKSHCVQQDLSSRRGSYLTCGGTCSYVWVSSMQKRRKLGGLWGGSMSLKIVFLLNYEAVKSTDKCRM